MRLELMNPRLLKRNPWNANHLTPEAELKLRNSIERNGMFKPVVVRELANGDYEILGGQHRVDQAIMLNMDEVPVANIGTVSDVTAMEIGLADNARYGQDDAGELAKIVAMLGSPEDLASFLPMDMGQIEAITAVSNIDLDTLGFDEDDATPVEERPARLPKTHIMMRFKVPLDDQRLVEGQIKQIIADMGYKDSDSLVNAGDALVAMARQLAAAAA